MRKNKKQRRVMFLLILILSITIGFALLSTTLFINGTANIKSNTWNIHWDSNSIEETTGSVTATTPASVTDAEEKNISFAVEFELPGDFYEFSADAVNEGSIDGKIENVNVKFYEADGTTEIDKDDLPEEITYSLTHKDGSAISENEVIAHGGKISYKFRIGFNSETTSLPSNNIIVKPNIEITPVQHKEDTYTPYKLGDVVYFDPVSTNKCDSTTFSVDAINNGTSTCYKWNVITLDDAKDKTDIELQLDHNIINKNRWSSYSYNTKGPDLILQDLDTVTSSWGRVPLLNYTYDTTLGGTNTGSNYGVLNCVNGVCTITNGNSSETYTSAVRARIITGEEMRGWVMHSGAAAGSTADNWTIESNSGSLYSVTYKFTAIGTMSSGETSDILAWTVANTDYGTSNTSEYATVNLYGDWNWGYWTLSPASSTNNSTWYYNAVGIFMQLNRSVDTTQTDFGIRPVVKVSKTMIVKG